MHKKDILQKIASSNFVPGIKFYKPKPEHLENSLRKIITNSKPNSLNSIARIIKLPSWN